MCDSKSLQLALSPAIAARWKTGIDARQVSPSQVQFAKGEARSACQCGEISLLDRARVVRDEAVDPEDVVAAGDEALREVRADEPGRAGNQVPHVQSNSGRPSLWKYTGRTPRGELMPMDDLVALATQAADLLKERNETIAVAETSAGGLLSAALLAVPGASAYFVGGAVTYTRTSRLGLLGITDEDMAGMRSASEPYAMLLARTARARLGTVWGLAETGASGPTGNRYGDAAGHTCVAVSGPGGEASRTLETASAERLPNMYAFTEAALRLLLESLRR
jgi:PncC family amidohydrolase